MDLRSLSERVSYFPATRSPLSAEIGIVRGDQTDWIFDVGNGAAAVEAIRCLSRQRIIVLSHFHEDHTGNWGQIPYREMYCGEYTRRKLQAGTEIVTPITCHDGITLTIFPLPSTHSKGAVGLVVNDEYAFLGDATYGVQKQGRIAYNLNKLREMISALEAIRARYFLISHAPTFVQPKEPVIAKLKALYERRKPGEAFLYLTEA